ncbi:MAG TPA: ISL3 family transposase [Ktedonobacterales bacterium]
MQTAATILPHPELLELLRFSVTETTVTAIVATKATQARCPGCGAVSSHMHSRYVRSVADLPWQGIAFRLRLHVRRFFCDDSFCSRTPFAERLPGLVAPHARRTERFDAWIRSVGFALGGEAGTRLLQQLGLLAASPDTLLRQIRHTALPVPVAAPRVVGVDDWRFRRGQRYGAIVVDLERRAVLDLLPDREAETIAAWFRAHPSVEVISRDRGATFADGATRGAPQAIQAIQAIQVADRFHGLKNLMEAFQRVLGREQALLRLAAQTVTAAPLSTETRPLTAPERQARADARRRARSTRDRREARYRAVRHRRSEGKTLRDIAAAVHMGPNTIRRLLDAESCPVPAQRQRQTTLRSAFEPYGRARWNAGEQNGQQLLREIRERGYRGGQATLYGLLGRWRPGPRHSGPYPRQVTLAQPVPPPLRTSAREVSWMLLKPASDLDPVERA